MTPAPQPKPTDPYKPAGWVIKAKHFHYFRAGDVLSMCQHIYYNGDARVPGPIPDEHACTLCAYRYRAYPHREKLQP